MRQLLILLVVLLFSNVIQSYPKYYLIKFPDKRNSIYTLSQPSEYLSESSINRRINQNLSLDSSDLPVSDYYQKFIIQKGYQSLYYLKWLNGAVIKIKDSLEEIKLKSDNFYFGIKRLLKKNLDTLTANKNQSLTNENSYSKLLRTEYGKSYAQINIHNGYFLHKQGFRGQGIKIGQLDAGFYKLNQHKGINIDRIKRYKNYVQLGSDSDNIGTHAILVLSIMLGDIPNVFSGSAPEGDYYCYTTENDTSEYPIEEYAWLKGLEDADSSGVQVLNSSLGYTRFDSSIYDHQITDLNGQTLDISRIANMALLKGIIVVNSAGNEGTKSWKKIGAPADAENVLTIGAVDTLGEIGQFSSRGPTSDGRIKPDVCAVGVQTYCLNPTEDNKLEQVSGTSAAAPIITGLTACLWQAFPNATARIIKQVIIESSNQLHNPDTTYGYGIPDFRKAFFKLTAFYSQENDLKVELFPNPSTQEAPNIILYQKNNFQGQFILVDLLGRILYERQLSSNTNTHSFKIPHQNWLEIPSGQYFAIFKSNNGQVLHKSLVKITE